LSAFLSASSDGRIFLWDLNRFEFVRELDLGPAQKRTPDSVQAAKINNVTGRITLACGPRLFVTTLNGELLLDQDISDGDDDFEGITALALYEGVGNEWCERELIFTGHRRGAVKVRITSPTTHMLSLKFRPDLDIPPDTRILLYSLYMGHIAHQTAESWRPVARRWRKSSSTHYVHPPHAAQRVHGR
jgi:hypothetical protein